MPKKFICTVHDNATDLLENILDEVKETEVHTSISLAIELIAEARLMGIRMENGLAKRKKEIKELEETIEDLEKSLELSNSDIKYLRDEVEYLTDNLALCESQKETN